VPRFSCEFPKSKVLDEATPDPEVGLDTDDEAVPEASDSTEATVKEPDQVRCPCFWKVTQEEEYLSAVAQV